jgi:hypothetical protein
MAGKREAAAAVGDRDAVPAMDAVFPLVATARAAPILPPNVENSSPGNAPGVVASEGTAAPRRVAGKSSDRPAFASVALEEGAPRPVREGPNEWLEDARHYNRHLQWVLVWLSTALSIPALGAVLYALGGTTGGWYFYVVAFALFTANVVLLCWCVARAITVVARADKRLRLMGYAAGSAHDALRVIETCAESGEVRVVCPPPRDEMAITPAWPGLGESERQKLGRALYEVGFPSRRRPWKLGGGRGDARS